MPKPKLLTYPNKKRYKDFRASETTKNNKEMLHTSTTAIGTRSFKNSRPSERAKPTTTLTTTLLSLSQTLGNSERFCCPSGFGKRNLSELRRTRERQRKVFYKSERPPQPRGVGNELRQRARKLRFPSKEATRQRDLS